VTTQLSELLKNGNLEERRLACRAVGCLTTGDRANALLLSRCSSLVDNLAAQKRDKDPRLAADATWAQEEIKDGLKLHTHHGPGGATTTSNAVTHNVAFAQR